MRGFRPIKVVAPLLLLAASVAIGSSGTAFADEAKSPPSVPAATASSADAPVVVTPPERTFTAGSAVAPAGGHADLPTSDKPTPPPPGGFPTHVRPADPPLAESPTAQKRAGAPSIPQVMAAKPSD